MTKLTEGETPRKPEYGITRQSEQPQDIKRILISDPLPDVFDPLREKGYVVHYKPGIPRQELLETIGEYNGLIVRSETKVDRELLDKATNLEIVARAGVGVNNVKVETATELGITVANTPEASTNSVAELTIAHMLGIARKVAQADREIRQGRWKEFRKEGIGIELDGKTLFVVGFGNIGQEVAKKSLGLGMTVIATDKFPRAIRAAEEMGVPIVDLEEGLPQADFVTIHVPLIDETIHLINKDRVGLMKDGAYLINVARGGIVDEKAVVDAIEAGKLSGAGFDVLETEPEVPEYVLNNPYILLTSHLGASTQEAQKRVAQEAVQQILQKFEDRIPTGVVNMRKVDPEILKEIGPYAEVAFSLSSLARQIGPNDPTSLHIEYRGTIGQHDAEMLQAAAIQGFMSGSTEKVNAVNFRQIAEKNGIQISESRIVETDDPYASSIKVRTGNEQGNTTVTGLSIHGHTEIVDVNDFPVKFSLNDGDYLLILKNDDSPGMVGEVTQRLGEFDVNISTMSLGRKTEAKKAMMAILLDSGLSSTQVDEINKINGVQGAQLIRIR